MKYTYFSFLKNIFGIVFFVVIATLLFSGNIEYERKIEFLLSNVTIFLMGIIILLISIFLHSWIRNKKIGLKKWFERANVDKVVLLITAIWFLGQCYVFYNIFFLSDWDTIPIRNFVDVITSNSDRTSVNFYFSRYPNNLFISYLYLFLDKVNYCYGVFDDQYKYMIVVILNCVINSASCWLSYKTAKIFVSSFWAFVSYAFCLFSVGISGWSVICYSDSLALFIPILSIYLYCKKYNNVRLKMIAYLMAGMLSVVGYFIKPQCLFVLFAIVLLEIVKVLERKSWKSLLCPLTLCLVAMVVFACVNFRLDLLNKKYDIVINDEQTFGYTHFLMMGANEEKNGVYSGEDVEFSGSFSNSDERREANIEIFKKRIKEMKSDLILHLRKKLLTTFNDGTFAWGKEGEFFYFVPENLNNKMAPFLKSIYHFGDRYIYFATFQHIIWMFILIGSFLTVFCKKNYIYKYDVMLLWIILLGFILYELLFEVRARYVYIFVPILCVMSSIGIQNGFILLLKIKRYVLKKKG